tara:strand:- start:229 stop:1449 length:1221 start_codon:yes stop_codon:yes gene_type:complete
MTKNELNIIVKESLRDWFKKEKWVRISTAGNIAGPCGTSKNKKNPDRCLPAAKARSLTKAQRAATARKKRKAGAKGKTVVKNTKKATVQKEVRVYGDTKITDMLEKLAKSIGREKFAMHILYDMPKDIKRDILDALDFKKGGIYDMDTLYPDAVMQENINAKIDQIEKTISKIPGVGKLVAGGIDKLQGQVNNMIQTAREEAGETRDMLKVVARYLKGETISGENQEFIKRQLLDLLKINAVVFGAITKKIPFVGLLGFIIAKLGLTDEVFALSDEDKRTTRGQDDRKAFAGKIKTFDGVKYVPYNDVLPFLKKGEYSVKNENVAPNHDGKAAPFGSGYKKITKEDIINLVVGLLEERKPISEKKKKKKDDRCTRIAKRKYDTWPSAYASGAVVRCRRGEIWKGEK